MTVTPRQMTDYDLARMWVDIHDEVDERSAEHPDLWVSLIARVERDKRKKEQ